MKFYHKLIVWFMYCVGLVHGVSYIIRIGRPRNPPALPGQIWDLPGIGHVIIVRVEGSYVFYESLDDREQTWHCRISTFKDHASLVINGSKPSPISHLISSDNDNVIQLKKDTNDSVR